MTDFPFPSTSAEKKENRLRKAFEFDSWKQDDVVMFSIVLRVVHESVLKMGIIISSKSRSPNSTSPFDEKKNHLNVGFPVLTGIHLV